MKTLSIIRVAFLSLIIMLVSCSKDESIQNLTKADLVGTWKTEYFEISDMRGPLTATFTNDNWLRLEYYVKIDDSNNIWNAKEYGTYTISGNKIVFDSDYGYQTVIEVENFRGDTASFGVYNDEISFSVKATKQD